MTKEKAKIRISDNIDYLSKEKERISTIADAQMYEDKKKHYESRHERE